jgi:ligand-binding sensor domain-containing protein
MSEEGLSFEKPNEYKIIASNSPVKAFVVKGNDLWYATDEILILQPLNAKTHQTFPKMGNVASSGIKSIVIDPLARVWIGGESGLAVRIGSSFTSYTTAEGLPDNKIQAIAAGTGGEVWVGTEKGAARFRDGSWTTFTTAQGLPSDNVQALLSDTRGRIYLGTRRGLSIYDGAKFQNYDAKNTGSTGIEWNNIKVLGMEVGKDVVWMTDGPKNIVSFDGKTWRRFMEIQEGITSIMHDTRRMWFGSEAGLLRFNGEEWISDPKRHGVPVEQVYAMFRDDKGDLWFAMEKGVLHLSNPYRK